MPRERPRLPPRAVARLLACVLLLAAAPPALALSPQTLTDPIGDNCRDYGTALGSLCGPDISQVVFSAPGDGNLHVDITYVSLPPAPSPELPAQTAEFAELGIYSISATTPDLNADSSAFRVAQTSPGVWTLQSITTFTIIDTVTAIPRTMGLELVVPLTSLGAATDHKYAVNAGSPAEAIPDGRGVHMIDGKMQDDATWKQCQVMVQLAEMLAAKDPELAESYGFAPAAV